ncbi:MAG: hypothetical protein KJ955_03580 [Nanoarchaeota archaeon]|nr:hypothetical protein [Nanoarchaeota archaeon]
MANKILEKILRDFGWYEAVAGIAMAAAVAGAVLWAHDRGYEKGKHEASAAAEAQEINLEVNSSAKSVSCTSGLYSATGGDCGYFVESLFVDQPEGRYLIVDGDGLMQAPSGGFYPMFHDEEVDFVDTPEGDRFVRPKNYEMHRDLFDKADEWLKEANEGLD